MTTTATGVICLPRLLIIDLDPVFPVFDFAFSADPTAIGPPLGLNLTQTGVNFCSNVTTPGTYFAIARTLDYLNATVDAVNTGSSAASSGLSTTLLIVAIVVPIVGAILIVGALYYFWVYRKKARVPAPAKAMVGLTVLSTSSHYPIAPSKPFNQTTRKPHTRSRPGTPLGGIRIVL